MLQCMQYFFIIAYLKHGRTEKIFSYYWTLIQHLFNQPPDGYEYARPVKYIAVTVCLQLVTFAVFVLYQSYGGAVVNSLINRRYESPYTDFDGLSHLIESENYLLLRNGDVTYSDYFSMLNSSNLSQIKRFRKVLELHPPMLTEKTADAIDQLLESTHQNNCGSSKRRLLLSVTSERAMYFAANYCTLFY